MKLTENKQFLSELEALIEKYKNQGDTDKGIGPVESYLCKKDYEDEYIKGEVYEFRTEVDEDVFTIYDKYGHKISENSEWLSEYFVKVDKPSKNGEPFKIEKGKWYMCIKDYEDAYEGIVFKKGEVYQAQTDKMSYHQAEGLVFLDNQEVQDYFRPATEDEIPHEPKFKIGDWVIDNCGNTSKIAGINLDFKTYDYIYTPNGESFTEKWKLIEDICHLWTLADAKDGDVLVYGDNPIDHHVEIIMLFKSIRQAGGAFTYFHTFDEKYRVDNWSDCGQNAHPATKAQRDLLFSKMKEAGYEWDADKKELKKIAKRWRDDEDASATGFQLCMDGKLYHTDEVYFNEEYAFATKAQAKSALAMACISLIMTYDERFGGVVTDEEWNDDDCWKYVIRRYKNTYTAYSTFSEYHFLAFHTAEQRDLFMQENKDLVRDYLMIPKKGE